MKTTKKLLLNVNVVRTLTNAESAGAKGGTSRGQSGAGW